MIPLTTLQAQFIRLTVQVHTWTMPVGNPWTWEPGDPTIQVTAPRFIYVYAATLAVAHGIRFLCPLCYTQNGGIAGTHCVVCWFDKRGLPPRLRLPEVDVLGVPGRWQVLSGSTGYSDLTLDPSIYLPAPAGCQWFGRVLSGSASF